MRLQEDMACVSKSQLGALSLHDVACYQYGDTLYNSKMCALFDGRSALFRARKQGMRDFLKTRGVR